MRHLLAALALLLACGGSPLSGDATAPNDSSESWAEPPGLPPGTVRLVPQLGMPDGETRSSIDISPDGRLALVGGERGGVEVWELATRLLVLSRKGRERGGLAQFAGNGHILLGSHGQLLLLDLDTPDKPTSLSSPSSHAELGGLAVSADGRRALTVWHIQGFEALWVAWDLVARKPMSSAKLRYQPRAMSLSPDGSYALFSQGTRVALWDLASAAALRELHADEHVQRLAISADGKLALGATSRGAILWDVTSANELQRYEDRTDAIGFTPDGQHVVLVGAQEVAGVWSVASGKRDRDLAGFGLFTEHLRFTPDGKQLLSASDREARFRHVARGRSSRLEAAWGAGIEDLAVRVDGKVVASSRKAHAVFDLEQGRLVDNLEARYHRPPTGERGRWLAIDVGKATVMDDSGKSVSTIEGRDLIRSGGVSSDGKWVAIARSMSRQPLALFDADSGELHRELLSGQGSARALSFAHDSKYVLAYGGASMGSEQLAVWDTATGTRQHALSVGARERVASYSLSPTDHVAAVVLGERVRLWRYREGTVAAELAVGAPVSLVEYAQDGATLAIALVGGGLELWDPASGKRRIRLATQAEGLNHMKFSVDGKLLVTATSNGVVRVHALSRENNGVVPSLAYMVRGNEWLMFSDDGYFDASRGGTDLAVMVHRSRALRLDQLAYRFNRPDVLMRRMGFGSSKLWAYFRSLHARRLRKAGLSAKSFGDGLQVPSVRILAQKQRDETLRLELALSDATRGLASYNVFVNGVALYDMRGKPVEGNKTRISETITLTAGDNVVEASAVNTAGGESMRVQTRVSYQPTSKTDKGELYYLGFGVSKHRDKRLDLAYAHADALVLAKAFERSEMKTHVKVLTNAQVTTQSIRAAKSFVAKARPQDTFVLFIAGHGVHAKDGSNTYYFITHDTDVKRLSKTAADFELIEDLLVGIAPRRKLMLMDTCQSGEDGGGAARAAKGARGLRVRNVRGLELEGSRSKAAPIVPRGLAGRDRFIEVDLRRRSGAVVLSSSRGDELSYESDEAKHGVFTKAILEALRPRRADRDRNRYVSSDELLKYVHREVSKATGGAQNPTIDRDNPHVTVELPLSYGSR